MFLRTISEEGAIRRFSQDGADYPYIVLSILGYAIALLSLFESIYVEMARDFDQG